MNPAGRDCQAGGGGLSESVTAGAKGLWAGIVAFGIWGVLPVYWKQLEFMGATSLVAQRTCWTLLALWPLLLLRRKGICADRRVIAWHFLSGALIAGNWLLYVWATLNDRMIEGALGYYINPFFNMLFGALWFGERHSRLQLAAIATAFSGVLLQMPSVLWPLR